MGVTARLSPRAIADLDSIRDYLVPRSPRGAENVRRSISETIALLEHYPRAGHESTISGVRVIAVVRYDYLIYHKVGIDEVVILHIRHAARRGPAAGDM
jgi:toxin ParE1/3/4